MNYLIWIALRIFHDLLSLKYIKKWHFKLSVVAHACNPRILGVKTENCGFKVILNAEDVSRTIQWDCVKCGEEKKRHLKKCSFCYCFLGDIVQYTLYWVITLESWSHSKGHFLKTDYPAIGLSLSSKGRRFLSSTGRLQSHTLLNWLLGYIDVYSTNGRQLCPTHWGIAPQVRRLYTSAHSILADVNTPKHSERFV